MNVYPDARFGRLSSYEDRFIFHLTAADSFEQKASRRFGLGNARQPVDGKVNVYTDSDYREGYTVIFSFESVEITELRGHLIEVLDYEDSDTPESIAREVMEYTM